MNFWNSRSEDVFIPLKNRMDANEKGSTNKINNQIKFNTHPFIPPSFNRNIVNNPIKNSLAHQFPFNLPCRDLSDKYDPFMSAKRQMEELFMPVASYASPTQRTTLPNSTSGVGTMSTSFTGPSSSSIVTPKTSTNTTQFRRTASLRVPKKKLSKPLLTLPSMTKPSTIQRGISVEGPVSSSFLKPEEYDEIPVKCHTIVSPKLAPSKETSPRRDIRQATPPDSARSRAVTNYNILKADSLATFLKYEDEIRNESPCLTEKERKDKSNSLNRQTLFQQSFQDINENRMEPEPPSPEPQKSQHQNEPDSSPEPPQHSKAIDSNLSTPSSEFNYLFVDPKLINSCDNLNVDEPDLVTDSNANIDDNFANLVDKYEPQPTQRSSVEKRSLKRHLKLNKENFLYDNDASDKDSISYDNDRVDSAERAPQAERSAKDGIEALFHDFDFEEFISSFEDDDKYPIFKGYKELISSRSNMLHSKDTMLKNFNELRIDDEILDFNNAADEMRSSNATSSGLYMKDDRIEPHGNEGSGRLRSGSSDIDERIKADTNASSVNLFSFTRNDTAKSNTDSAYSRLVRCFGTCNVFLVKQLHQIAYNL